VTKVPHLEPEKHELSGPSPRLCCAIAEQETIPHPSPLPPAVIAGSSMAAPPAPSFVGPPRMNAMRRKDRMSCARDAFGGLSETFVEDSATVAGNV